MTALFNLVGIRGAIGIVLALALSTLLVIQKGETRHWKKQSGQFELLYHAEQTALAGTVANYRAAAAQAQAADQANAQRVVAEQKAINERTSNDFEARLADARARAQRLQQQLASSPAYTGSPAAAAVSSLSAAAGRSLEAARQGGLSPSDQLTATEQAIQLDELIKWVRKQAGIDVNGQR